MATSIFASCAAPARVAIEISTIEDKRKDAVRRFWLSLLVAHRARGDDPVASVGRGDARLRHRGGDHHPRRRRHRRGAAARQGRQGTEAAGAGDARRERRAHLHGNRLRSAGLSRGAQGAVRQLALQPDLHRPVPRRATRTAAASRSTKARWSAVRARTATPSSPARCTPGSGAPRAAARSSSSPTAASSTSSSRSAAWSGSGSRTTPISRRSSRSTPMSRQQAMMMIGADVRRAAARAAPGGPGVRLCRPRGRVRRRHRQEQVRGRLDVPRGQRRAARPQHVRRRLRRASPC